MVGGRGVRLADEVALADEELFLCIDVDAAERRSTGPAGIGRSIALGCRKIGYRRRRSSSLIEASGKVMARRRVTFDDLVLEEAQAALPRRAN